MMLRSFKETSLRWVDTLLLSEMLEANDVAAIYQGRAFDLLVELRGYCDEEGKEDEMTIYVPEFLYLALMRDKRVDKNACNDRPCLRAAGFLICWDRMLAGYNPPIVQRVFPVVIVAEAGA